MRRGVYLLLGRGAWTVSDLDTRRMLGVVVMLNEVYYNMLD